MSNDARSSDLPETLVCPKAGGFTRALLIGVDIYLNVNSLYACSNDVEDFNRWLQKNVFPKTDENNESTIHSLKFDPKLFNPTLETIIHDESEPRVAVDDSLRSVIESYIKTCPFYHIIEDELDRLFKKVTEKDNLIILFSGHGFEVDGESYLAPADLILTKDNEYKIKTALSLRGLINRLNECPAKFKWLIINACRIKVEGVGNDSVCDFGTDELPLPAETVILQSCQSKESSLTDNEFDRSIFIQALVAALDGKADSDEDGMISMKDVIDYVTEETGNASGHKHTPCCRHSLENLEGYIVICNKTEGMTPEQLAKGRKLVSDAKVFYEYAEKQEKIDTACTFLTAASECVQKALQLIPEPPKGTVNPKDGKHKSEWKKLLRKIETLKNSREMSKAQPSSRKEVDSGVALSRQDLLNFLEDRRKLLKATEDRSKSLEALKSSMASVVQRQRSPEIPNVPQIQPPVGDNIHTDKRNSRQPQEQNIDPYDEYKTPPTKDQKIETLDNQNSQQNENQRLPLKDDNIQQTNVSKKDIRPDENQMKNGESDSAE